MLHASRCRTLATFAVALTFACSSEQPGEAGTDANGECAGAMEFYAGISQKSTNGVEVTILEADPAPPQLGDNVWLVRITDPAGAPLDDAVIVVKSVMPKHGSHSSPRAAFASSLGDGKYEISPLNFNMDMLWRTTLEIRATPTAEPEHVVFEFCVAG